MLAFLLLVALPGCSSWIDGAPACNKDVYSWSDDLLGYILTGNGDGAFDFDPVDTPRQNLSGRYNYATGDFTWDVQYASTYWRSTSAVSGFGTAYHSGDLDLLYTSVDVDILGAETTTTTRVVREGCKMTTASWTGDNESSALVQSGSYEEEDAYKWTAEDDNYTYQGGTRQNLSRTLGYDAKDGSRSVSLTYKPEGTSDATLAGTWDSRGRTYDGTQHGRFDGGTEGAYTVYDTDGSVYETITSNYAYDGSGTERQVDADGNGCDLQVTAGGDCSYTCDDGSSGNCG